MIALDPAHRAARCARQAESRRAKEAVRARIVDPAFDAYAPREDLSGKSPFGFALFGAQGDDCGDGPWVYERDEGREDLRVLLAQNPDLPADPTHRRMRDEALSLLAWAAA